MKTYFARLLPVLLLAIGAPALANEYRTYAGYAAVDLKSQEGFAISFRGARYKSGLESATEKTTIEEINVSVQKAGVSPGKVRVVLVPNCDNREYNTPATHNLTLDLSGLPWNPSIASGDSKEPLLISYALHGGVGPTTCRPQLAVVVDGIWLTDPVNGTHNFNLNGL